MKQERDSIDSGPFLSLPRKTRNMERKRIREELIGMRNKLDELIKLLGAETETVVSPKPKGRPIAILFHKEVDEDRLAICIMRLHQQHFNEMSHVIEVNEVCYGETDFMLCIYFALVKLQLAPTIKFHQINKQYYHFLTEKCGIKLTEKERTYNNHLNKIVRTGEDLHCLTEEIVCKNQSEGTMKLEELATWHQMLQDAESLLMTDDYICLLAKK